MNRSVRRWAGAAALAVVLAAAGPTEAASLAGLAKEQGNGSRFKLYYQSSANDMQVALTNVDPGKSKVVIEVFAAAEMSEPLWQQFVLGVSGDKPTVEAGYLQLGNSGAPMKFDAKNLAGVGGLDVSLFMMTEADLRNGVPRGMKLIGRESVTTPAGKVACSHLRLDSAAQKLDFWISDEARPIGLVRMVSEGKKDTDNYRLELQELLSGVAAKIDPTRAGPMTDQMKSMLGLK
jgi:hypothetical protein